VSADKLHNESAVGDLFNQPSLLSQLYERLTIVETELSVTFPGVIRELTLHKGAWAWYESAHKKAQSETYSGLKLPIQ
jgi:hypothetical protein